MTGLRDYLQRRHADIVKRLEPLHSNASELRAKLGTIEGEVRTLTNELNEIDKALQAIGKPQPSVTIKEAIMQALEDAPGGLTSAELLATINDRFFEGQLVRTSMSPQLARLWHRDKKITNRGDRYFLA